MIISAPQNIILAQKKIYESALLVEHNYNIQETINTKLRVCSRWQIYDIANIPCDSAKSCSLNNSLSTDIDMFCFARLVLLFVTV